MSFQKTLKMTNKAILRQSSTKKFGAGKIDQMSVTNVLTNDYNRLDTWYREKNKAISKPFCSIKPQKSAFDFNCSLSEHITMQIENILAKGQCPNGTLRPADESVLRCGNQLRKEYLCQLRRIS